MLNARVRVCVCACVFVCMVALGSGRGDGEKGLITWLYPDYNVGYIVDLHANMKQIHCRS